MRMAVVLLWLTITAGYLPHGIGNITIASGRNSDACTAIIIKSIDIASPHGEAPSAPFDLAFIDAVLQRTTSTLTLSSLALQRTGDSRIWRIALRISESRATEIHLLREWRMAWFPDAPVWPSPSTPEPDFSIATACADSAFDRYYLGQTIENELAVIALATSARDRATRPELRDVAESLISSRTTEIESLQELLQSLAT